MTKPRAPRRAPSAPPPGSATAVVVVLLVVAHLYFLNAHPRFDMPNVISRVYMTLAIVDHGNLRIDPYLAIEDSQDKAVFDGHYYSDKAPGLSLWLVPFAWALRHTFFPAPDLHGITIALRVVGLSLPMVGFWWFACAAFEEVSGSRRAALALVLAGALGTNFFIYATNLFGHTPAASLLFTSFLAVRRLARPGASTAWAFGSGLLLGAAFVTDYVVMFAVVVLGVYALYATRERPATAAAYALGALLPLCVWMGINTVSYGSPFTVGFHLSGDEQFRQGYQSGLGGIQPPNVSSLVDMWFSRQHGMVFLSPVLLLGPIGLYRLWRDTRARTDASLAFLMIAGLALFTSTTLDWTGGWATGVRYMVPAVPLLLWGAAACLRTSRRTYGALALCALSLPGFVLVGAAAATFPFFPGFMADPLFHFALPSSVDSMAGRSVTDLFGVHVSGLPFFVLIGIAFYVVVHLSFATPGARLRNGVLAVALGCGILALEAASSPEPTRVDRATSIQLLEYMGYRSAP